MQTLESLRSGGSLGATKLKLSGGLTSIPEELFALKDTLEILDLSNNLLTELPTEFRCLQKLKIFFCSNNRFEQFPAVLSQIPSLVMVAFKSNGMRVLPEDTLGPNLRWLILTDNKISHLPQARLQSNRVEIAY